MGHACGIAGRAGVAATVDGEGLPNFQGPCGWEWGTERGEGTMDIPGKKPAGLLHIPPWCLCCRPLNLPPCPFVRSMGEPGPASLPAQGITWEGPFRSLHLPVSGPGVQCGIT